MMKKVATFLFLLLAYHASGQEITGQWSGKLKLQGIQLRVLFNISKTDSGYSSTMDSPDQGAKDIPVTSTTFENSKLKLEIPTLTIVYEGTLNDTTITGTFKQRGMKFPLDLSRGKIEIKRPQEPVEPYPYHTEDVTFTNNKANITLAGTLTLPKKEGVYPVVVLITGSGAQNRNEEILGHKPFLIISDYLTRSGIAVLRYDDRGTAKSTGDFSTVTSVELASDVKSAIDYLKTRKEIDKTKIGLVGHSEGGLIAPMVASESKDVSFIVLLAGPGIRGDQILLLQQELIAKAMGISEADIQKTKETNSKIFEMILKSKDNQKLKTDLTEYLKKRIKDLPDSEKPQEMTDEEYISLQINQITNPWMLYFLRFDPAPVLKKVKCPVLAINGEKDLQVPPKENLNAIENALKKGDNKKYTIKELPNLNHLFQECKTGAPTEYSNIEQTFSPVALEEITKWILDQTK